jgi:hypothetical protein
MNLTPQNPGGNQSHSWEATLHLIAHAPVPEGIEDRVHAALKMAPHSARLLAWTAPWSEGGWAAGWMRAAAAAAIVGVVTGGGWGVYSSVQHQAGKVVAVPVVQSAPAAGFSSAGAIRTPQTVKGTVLVQPDKNAAAKAKSAKKAGAQAAQHAAAAVQRAGAK